MKKVFVFVILIFFASNVLADEKEIVPLLQGKQAPFSGLLVKEDRFGKMVLAEDENRELIVNVGIQSRLIDNQAVYIGQLEGMVYPPKWYETQWAAFVLGIVVAFGAVYVGAKAID